MSNRRSSIFLVAALLAPLAGGCDLWEEVTLDDSDDTAPVAAARILELGGAEVDKITYGSGPGATLTTSDPSREFVAIAAAYDLEGAHKVTMHREYSRQCEDGDIGMTQWVLLEPLVEVQPGAPGDVVNNGVWTGDYVALSKFGSCPSGFTLAGVSYFWWVEAENYFGTTAFHGPALIRYQL